jgi:hypothetical protein
MDREGLYVYCFARSGMVPAIRVAGIDGGGEVTAREVKGVVAVCSQVPLDEFAGQSAETNMNDLAWVVPRVCRHEQVIEEVMDHSPVLPVRFGAVFSSNEALAEFLEGKCEEICRFLDSVSDKEEWCVKGFLDPDRTSERLLASDPVLSEQCKQMSTSPGTRYFQQKRLRAAAEGQAKRWSQAVAQQVQEELKNLAVELCPLELRPPGVSGRDADMVLNCALLLLRRRVADFRSEVENIRTKYAEEGLMVDLSGPWPPYNFCPSLGREPD